MNDAEATMTRTRGPDAGKAITLRNLPEPIARAVRERAAKYQLSLNQAVIQLLGDAVGGSGARAQPVYHDLDHLFGAWSEETAREVERVVREVRRIDPEMWE
jgi:plasmid stability protein